MGQCKRSMQSAFVVWVAFAALVIPAAIAARNFEDQKSFLPPYGTPPVVSYSPPSHGSGDGHATPTPSHGGSPPANCGNPPSSGGGHHSTPSTPSPHHSTPSAPSHGSGGYYHSPPTSTPTPATPAPVTVTPPSTPSTPIVTVPSPPSSYDPNSPPFTCTYWKNHPALIWGIVGWSGTTVGKAFGVSSLPGIGAGTDIMGALSDPRTDGLGELCREGTAALLNSMIHKKFAYTTDQVKEKFVAACASIKAAAAQAEQFKLANEGKLIPQA